MPAFLAPNDAHIWFRVTETLDEDGLTRAVSQLSDEERARYGRFVTPRDRRDFALSHALLRRALSTYVNVPPEAWRFGRTAHGKPYLRPHPAAAQSLAFNLSHTHGLVAAVVARGADVGIDVESIDSRRDDRAVAERCFSAAENAALDACDKDERTARFIELWTLKEAYLKAVGSGLTEALDTFEFVFDGARGLRFVAPPGTSAVGWTFALFAPSPSTRMAIAITSERRVSWQILARADDGDGRDMQAVGACAIAAARSSASP